MKYLLQIFKAWLDGFLGTLGLLLLAGAAWYAYTQYGDELAGLPLIQELTDTYKVGWQETVLLGGKVALRMVQVDGDTYIYTDSTRQTAPVGAARQGHVSLAIPWQRAALEEKLRAQGWSRGKMRAAGHYLDYIDLYLEEALLDMYRTGVSASITLAQGILESNAGKSNLAKKTNNHFGIKALANAEGRRKLKGKQYGSLTNADFRYIHPAVGVSQHHDDHKYDRFEVYTTVQDSYRRHSQLLQKGCTTARKGCYAWIWKAYPVQEARVDIGPMASAFEQVSGYAPKDYFGKTVVPYYAAQAAGLKMAGYATSPTYHQKLVYIIETYELWRLDIALTRATT